MCNTEHGHHHPHTQTKQVQARLARAAGHLEAVRRMLEEGRDCTEILIQLSAVRSAINNAGKLLLKDHMEHCVADAVAQGDTKALEKLGEALDQYMK